VIIRRGLRPEFTAAIWHEPFLAMYHPEMGSSSNDLKCHLLESVFRSC